ncbi:MAG TPA: type II CAAX endopeptidase family protein [Candidatus Limnocylindrales bacterium]|nr:type II CAAX endopeptidase family protein [Candidatus Limnocylindrales bacterium]
MTDPSRPDGPAGPDAPEDSPDPETEREPETEPGRALGLTAFTMEGRQAPALFVVGWLATLVGGGFVALRFLGVAGFPGVFLFYAGLAVLVVGLVLLGGSQAVERRAAGLAYAGPSPMLVLLAVLAATQVAGLIVGLPLELIGGSIPRPLGDLIAVTLQALVTVGVIRLMVIGADALSWRDMGIRFDREQVLRGLATGAAYTPVVVAVVWILGAVLAQFVTQVPESPLPPTGNAVGVLLHLLAGAVIAPVAEELLFRGFALTAWSRSVGDRPALIRVTIVFVLAHVLTVGGDTFGDAAQLAFVAAVGRVPVAIALGWLFIRTRSLWAPIGLHAAYNAVLILLAEAYASGALGAVAPS